MRLEDLFWKILETANCSYQILIIKWRWKNWRFPTQVCFVDIIRDLFILYVSASRVCFTLLYLMDRERLFNVHNKWSDHYLLKFIQIYIKTKFHQLSPSWLDCCLVMPLIMELLKLFLNRRMVRGGTFIGRRLKNTHHPNTMA